MTEAIVVTPAGQTNGRAGKMLAVGLAVVLVLFIVPKVLGGGGGSDEDPFASTPTTSPRAAFEAGATPEVAETSHNFSAKNPFKPLVDVRPAAPAGGGAPAAVDASPSPAPAEVIVVDTGDPVTEPAAAPAPAPAPSTAPQQPVRFGLVQVGQDASGVAFASVRVDGGVFQAVEGQEFGGRFKVVSLDAASRCGVFLYGDQRFSLCEGEETTA